MTNNKGILIRNIYYMFSYAFEYLKEPNYENLGKETFENIYDLFAKILNIGITQQLKHGLYKEYIPAQDNLSAVRGKINLQESIPFIVQHKQRLNCEFDDFSEDNIYNQILKTTGNIVLKKASKKSKDELLKTLTYLASISEIDISQIKWNNFRFQRNNKNGSYMLND